MLAAMWVCTPAHAQGPAASPYPVVNGKAYRFQQVAEGVYYATSTGAMVTGSNNVVIVNDRDVLVVDTGTSPAAARAFVQDIKLLTDKPVREVVNTHFHYDHTDGNQVFTGSAEIIAHDYVRQALSRPDILQREPFKTSQLTNVPARIDTLKKQIADEKDAARRSTLQRQLAVAQAGWEELKEIKPTPPTVTYSSQLVLHKGQREIQILFLGRGHTPGDTFVFLPKERIVCTGDMMESQVAYMGDALFDEWIATLDALKKLDFDLVLPGHGVPFKERSKIDGFQSYLKDLMTQVAALRAQGVSADDAARRVDLTSHRTDFSGITGPGAEARGVRRMYEWMDEQKKPR
jgi:glyoxylase-like metal-dependent hydrolase (beta-lactamase superfamily II)